MQRACQCIHRLVPWLIQQICAGIDSVAGREHSTYILHLFKMIAHACRDLKTQNVFMSSGGLLKLGDFGVSKVLNSTWQLAATAVGTPYYLSPEICQNRKYNHKVGCAAAMNMACS